MILVILRGCFIILAASVAALYLLPFQQQQQLTFYQVVLMLGGTVAIAAIIVAIDFATQRKRLSALSGVFLGLIAGLIAAYALSFVVSLVGILTAPTVNTPAPQYTPGTIAFTLLNKNQQNIVRNQYQVHLKETAHRESYFNFLSGIKVIIGLITCYLGISLVLQTKDDFRFVLPYVEFAKEIRGNRPTLLDTSVIVDGRILDIIKTHTMQGSLIVPKFVLEELQTIADSADKLRRTRGRRGLDILQQLEQDPNVAVTIEEHDAEGNGVDQKLITLAKQIPARLMTNDYNLNKIATLRGLEVINLNDLAKALRPVVLPGEKMSVTLVKAGENPTQGVGYLDDGTMIVVEGGRDRLHENVEFTVTSTLQTSAGRMIFGKFYSLNDTHTPAMRQPDPSLDSQSPSASDNPAPASASSESPANAPSSRRSTTGRNPRRSRPR